MEKALEFYDIYEYYYLPFWQTTWFKILITLITLTLIGVLLFIIIKRRQKPLLPWEWAQKELDKLTPEKCSSKDDFKKFYFRLTAIIKTYLHKQYDWQTEDKTDTELVAWLEQESFNPEVVSMLKKLADGALWIKFANMDALKSQAESDWKSVAVMIDQTKVTPAQTK
jgi:uncharacterized membrane protein YraQ (UPF0718 family)